MEQHTKMSIELLTFVSKGCSPESKGFFIEQK